jgi:hypothetical protein
VTFTAYWRRLYKQTYIHHKCAVCHLQGLTLFGTKHSVHHRETVFTTKLEHHYPRRGRTSETKTTKAAHWYIVLSDCALEFYEGTALCVSQIQAPTFQAPP